MKNSPLKKLNTINQEFIPEIFWQQFFTVFPIRLKEKLVKEFQGLGNVKEVIENKVSWRHQKKILYDEWVQSLSIESAVAVFGERGPLSSVIVVLDPRVMRTFNKSYSDTKKFFILVMKTFEETLNSLLKELVGEEFQVVFKLKSFQFNPHLVNALSENEKILMKKFSIYLGDIQGDFPLVLGVRSVELFNKKMEERKKSQIKLLVKKKIKVKPYPYKKIV
jgi:hypothetical protein